MRYRYRILTALLIASIVFSMISCKRSASNAQLKATLAPTAAPTAAPTPEPTPTPTPEPTSTPRPTPTSAPTPELTSDAFYSGSIMERGYRSEFLGFDFQIPGEWYIYAPESYDDINRIDLETMDEEAARKELVKRLERGTSVLDFYSVSRDYGSYITVFIHDFSLYEGPIDTELKALEAVEELVLLGDDDQKNTNIEYFLTEIAGRNSPVCRYDTTLGDESRQAMIIVVQRGSMFAFVQMVAEDVEVFQTVIDSLDLFEPRARYVRDVEGMT